jgi:hypothetical protein
MKPKSVDFFDRSRDLFDPITLGLHVPQSVLRGEVDITRAKLVQDEPLLHDSGVFVHELAHYLQFHGSWFGFNYLFDSQVKVFFYLQYLQHLCQTKRIVPPVAYYHPIDTKKVSDFIMCKEDQSIFRRVLDAEPFFQEELYGWTYPYLSIHPIYEDSGGVKQTSVLHLNVSDSDTPLCVTGKCLLENHAMVCEILHVHGVAKDRTAALLDKWYGDIKPLQHARYFAINDVFNGWDVLELAPIFYFIVLNQRLHNISFEHGNYNLVACIKKILFRSAKFRDISPPTTEDDLQRIVELVCSECHLDNPFEVLEDLRGYLRGFKADNPDYVTHWVALNVVEWTLENSLDAIWWPRRPMDSVMKAIPILNLYVDRSSNMPLGINVPDSMEDRVKTYLGRCSVRHVVDALMWEKVIRCPAWIYKDVRPSLVAECSACNGDVLSQEDNSSCPSLNFLRDLGISNIERRNT